MIWNCRVMSSISVQMMVDAGESKYLTRYPTWTPHFLKTAFNTSIEYVLYFWCEECSLRAIFNNGVNGYKNFNISAVLSSCKVFCTTWLLTTWDYFEIYLAQTQQQAHLFYQIDRDAGNYFLQRPCQFFPLILRVGWKHVTENHRIKLSEPSRDYSEILTWLRSRNVNVFLQM